MISINSFSIGRTLFNEIVPWKIPRNVNSKNAENQIVDVVWFSLKNNPASLHHQRLQFIQQDINRIFQPLEKQMGLPIVAFGSTQRKIYRRELPKLHFLIICLDNLLRCFSKQPTRILTARPMLKILQEQSIIQIKTF